jgi:hypothetical protein
MRFDTLVLALPGGPMIINFHPRMTVVGGLNWHARKGFVAGVVRALAGQTRGDCLEYTDVVGRRVRLASGDGDVAATYEEGAAAPGVLGVLAPDVDALRQLMLVEPFDLGLRVDVDPDADIDTDTAPDRVHQRLVARLARARHHGPDREPVPAVLNEVFGALPPDIAWDLLDMVERLSERAQVVYLTDDAFVRAWARQRAEEGAISFLDPADLA